MKQRDSSLDVIRILACIMVVLMHSPLPSDNANGSFLGTISYFTAPCIGLFFMVSGALLIPVKTDYITFISKRFSKIAIPTLIWSIIYITLQLYNSESEINILQSFASLPFSAQEGVLWFMYTLAGIYLIAPILSIWCESASKREIEFILLLWSITLCYPILNHWVTINTSTTGILYYFTGYAGYFLLGYYLRRFPKALPFSISFTLAISGIILLVLLKYYKVSFDFYRLFWYESIFIATLAIVIWKTICHTVKICPSKVLCNISNMTFGIYLIHILIMRHWLWNQAWIISIPNYILQSITIFLITFLLSIAVCWVLSHLPYSQWIIAFHKRITEKNNCTREQ